MNQKRRFRRRTWLILFCALSFLLSHGALAAGEGDGGGGGPSVPLEMDWSFPANGETGVSVHTVIQCKFSHNVAHFDVAPRNAGKFSLTREDGTQVEVEVYQVDAQLEFDKRQFVYLYPKQELEEYTTYIVTAEEGVQAKNGMVTEQTQTFRFTTGSRKTVPVAVVTPEPPEPVLEDKPVPKSAPQKIPQTAPELTPESNLEPAPGDVPVVPQTELETEPTEKEPRGNGETLGVIPKEMPLSWAVPAIAAVMVLVLMGSFCLTWFGRMEEKRN